jgi:hypothetical protein
MHGRINRRRDTPVLYVVRCAEGCSDETAVENDWLDRSPGKHIERMGETLIIRYVETGTEHSLSKECSD